MKTNRAIDKIEELLELGIGMGLGKRYLLVYEGELAITNRVGLANWPPGRREIVAQLDATDCLHRANSRKWDEIFEKLRAIEDRKANNAERIDVTGPSSPLRVKEACLPSAPSKSAGGCVRLLNQKK